MVSDLVNNQGSLSGWATRLASHGMVAMTVDPGSAIALGAARASSLTDGLAALRGENTRAGSILRGKLDTQHAALLGWGAGAHGALLAASGNASLSAVVSLSDPDTQTFGGLAVPVLLMAGQSALNQGIAQDVYAAVPAATPKLMLEFRNGSHQAPTDPSNQSGVVGRFGLSWLKTFLEGDTRYRQFLLARPTQASDFTTNLR
jgi:dienelactone hydrolase